jgi:hypothetical protein
MQLRPTLKEKRNHNKIYARKKLVRLITSIKNDIEKRSILIRVFNRNKNIKKT